MSKKKRTQAILAGSIISIAGIAAVANQCNQREITQFSERRMEILTSIVSRLSNYDSSLDPFSGGSVEDISAQNLLEFLSVSTAGRADAIRPSLIRTMNFNPSDVEISFLNNSYSINFVDTAISVEVFSGIDFSNAVLSSPANVYSISRITFNVNTDEINTGTWSSFASRTEVNSTNQSLLYFALSYLSNFNTNIEPPTANYAVVGAALISQLLPSDIFTSSIPASIIRLSFISTSIVIFTDSNQSAGFYIRIGTPINPESSLSGVSINWSISEDLTDSANFEPLYITDIQITDSVLLSSTWSLTAP